jgi:hypothetical protein
MQSLRSLTGKENDMGYRSDVTAVFYVNKVEHFPILKLWLTEHFPMDEFHDNIRWFDRGMVFKEDDVKWYDDYDEVKAFTKAVEDYQELIEDFDNSPVEGQPAFCYEFIRVGENYDDVTDENLGYHCDYLLGVTREITIKV